MRAIRPIPANYLSWDASGKLTLSASGTNQNITLTPSGTGNVTIDTAVNTKFYLRESGANGVEFQSSAGGCYITTVSTAPIIFRHSGATETVRIFNNGRLGIGTGNTDSGALLQIGTDTSNSAGGAVFGTNTQLYRSGEGLNLRDTTLANVGMRLLNNSGGACRVQMDNTYQLTLNSESGAVVLKSANTTGLTLDALQNATFAGTAITLASAAAKSGLRIPHGAAPTSPVNGDMWTTSAGLFVRINGATVGPLT